MASARLALVAVQVVGAAAMTVRRKHLHWFECENPVYRGCFTLIYAYGLRLYFDFAGYSDIAIGFHRALYGAGHFISGTDKPALVGYEVTTIATILCVVSVVSLVLLRLTWKVFFDLSGDFAEEL